MPNKTPPSFEVVEDYVSDHELDREYYFVGKDGKYRRCRIYCLESRNRTQGETHFSIKRIEHDDNFDTDVWSMSIDTVDDHGLSQEVYSVIMQAAIDFSKASGIPIQQFKITGNTEVKQRVCRMIYRRITQLQVQGLIE